MEQVVCFILTMTQGAEDAYKGALIASGNGAPDNSNEFTKEVKAQTVTMLYNLARLYEGTYIFLWLFCKYGTY